MEKGSIRSQMGVLLTKNNENVHFETHFPFEKLTTKVLKYQFWYAIFMEPQFLVKIPCRENLIDSVNVKQMSCKLCKISLPYQYLCGS